MKKKAKSASKPKAKQEPARAQNTTGKSKSKIIQVENDAGVIRTDSSGRVTEGRFAGYYRGPHGIYSRTSPQEHEQRERERRASDQAKRERFRGSCVQCRQLLADSNVLAYWLAQIRPVMETETVWQGLRYEWPRDKAKVYAVMVIAADTYSGIKILPDKLRQTEFYKVHKSIDIQIVKFDLAAEFLSYIEADLRDKGSFELERQGQDKRKPGRPGLPDEERNKREEILKNWATKKGEMSQRQFCEREDIWYKNATKNYLKTCQDWARQKHTN